MTRTLGWTTWGCDLDGTRTRSPRPECLARFVPIVKIKCIPRNYFCYKNPLNAGSVECTALLSDPGGDLCILTFIIFHN